MSECFPLSNELKPEQARFGGKLVETGCRVWYNNRIG